MNLNPNRLIWVSGGYLLAAIFVSAAQADNDLLGKILSVDAGVNRRELVAKVENAELRKHLNGSLQDIEAAATLRRRTLKLQADVEAAGGMIQFVAGGPDWLRDAAPEAAMKLFYEPVSIDLYNGNNPLKGRGGKNEIVDDAWLERLEGLVSLKSLNLANCNVYGEGLKFVGTLKKLEELNLTLTPVCDDGLSHLNKLTELRVLGLASTKCNGTGFKHLTKLKKLDNVNFHFTPLNDAGLEAICQVNNSGRFWFAHTHFTDKGAANLARLKELRRCGIGSQDPASSGYAVAALSELPLEELHLLDRQASPEGVAHASKIETLRLLDLSHAPSVTDGSLQKIASMPALEVVKIGGAAITNKGLTALAASKSLKQVTLLRMKQVTEEGVAELKRLQPDLVVEYK